MEVETMVMGGDTIVSSSGKGVECLLTDPDGQPLGSKLYLPENTGPLQLQQTVNTLLKNEEKVPYAFYISDQELVEHIGSYLEKNQGESFEVMVVNAE